MYTCASWSEIRQRFFPLPYKRAPERDRPQERQSENRNITQADFIKARTVQKGASLAKQTPRTHVLKECGETEGNGKTPRISPARATINVEIYLQLNMFTPQVMI